MPVRLAPAGGASGPLYCKGWDLGVLGGEKIPGRTRVTRGGIRLKTDKKPKLGQDGNRPTFHGVEPDGEIEIEIINWTDEQMEVLDALGDKHWPRPGVQRQPEAFEHPALRSLGTQRVFVQVVKVPVYALATDYGVSGRKLLVSLYWWLPTPRSGKQATSTPKTAAPTRSVANLRREDAARRNPLPTAQASAAKP